MIVWPALSKIKHNMTDQMTRRGTSWTIGGTEDASDCVRILRANLARHRAITVAMEKRVGTLEKRIFKLKDKCDIVALATKRKQNNHRGRTLDRLDALEMSIHTLKEKNSATISDDEEIARRDEDGTAIEDHSHESKFGEYLVNNTTTTSAARYMSEGEDDRNREL
eukprot:TRINITY_DN76542_c0_g1_i1.p1 TRINITY_DN76542_c0_g1~~TRINITY_DN76542_c0_g1_i1.p1  ORF type:complete len:166 (-),score=53.66 TRINITY_DN76542_c0_g1_i1:374-871(-)